MWHTDWRLHLLTMTALPVDKDSLTFWQFWLLTFRQFKWLTEVHLFYQVSLLWKMCPISMLTILTNVFACWLFNFCPVADTILDNFGSLQWRIWPLTVQTVCNQHWLLAGVVCADDHIFARFVYLLLLKRCKLVTFIYVVC